MSGTVTAFLSAPTLAALQAYAGLSTPNCQLQGTSAGGDGGEGIFWYDASDTTSPDNGVTIIVDALGRRWHRLFNNLVDVGVFTNTQLNQLYSYALGGANLTALVHASFGPDNFATDVLAAGMEVPSGSTVWNANAVAAYAISSAPGVQGGVAGTGTNVCALFAAAFANAATAAVWGLNTVGGDNGHVAIITGYECDIAPTNQDTVFTGINMTGAPATAGQGYGFVCSTFISTPMGIAFWAREDCAQVALLVEQANANTDASQDSMPIVLIAYDAGGVRRSSFISSNYTDAGGTIALSPAGDGYVQITSALTVGGEMSDFAGMNVVEAVGGVLAGFFNSSNDGVGSITTNGTTTAYNTTSDRDWKTVTAPADGSLIDALKVYTGHFNALPAVTRSLIIADELQEHAPYAVTGTKGQVYDADVYARDTVVPDPDGYYLATIPGAPIVGPDGRPVLGPSVTKKTEDGQTIVLPGPILHGPSTTREMHNGKMIRTPGKLLHKKGERKPQMVDHSSLIPDLVAHAQGTRAQCAQLAAENAMLAARLAEVEAVIKKLGASLP